MRAVWRAEWNTEYGSRGSFLVYNTGRPLQSVMALVEAGRLQRPTALICSEVLLLLIASLIFFFPFFFLFILLLLLLLIFLRFFGFC